ncbi:MAG: family 16 glycosylhydrolase [Bacteroidales bacterium]
MRYLHTTIFTTAILTSACSFVKQERPAPVGVENPGEWEYSESFSDEFEANNLDTTKWLNYNPNWMGREPALFVKENAFIRDGSLIIKGKREELVNPPAGYHTFSTAAVQSRKKGHYGFYEIRCKPMYSALSSAFWLYTNNGNVSEEIDIFEICGRHDTEKHYEHTYFATSHFIIFPKDIHITENVPHKTDFKLADEYITAGLDWNEEEIVWYLNGEVIRRRKNDFWQMPEIINFDSEAFPNWWGLPSDSDNGGEFIIEYFRHWKKK